MKAMIKEYKVNKHNSTVCGYHGREFDWSKFDWNQETKHDFGDMRYSIDSEYISKPKRGKKIGIQQAPKVYVDNGFIAENCQYLHVPYDYAEHATIYRVRPNESMYAGNIYRGHLVRKQTAIKKDDGWYWQLELED